MGKVTVLQYLSLIHYRRSLFDLLFEEERIDFRIVCGEDSPYSSMKNYQPEEGQEVAFVKNTKIFGSSFLIQHGVLQKMIASKPDVVILLGVNPLIVSSLYSALYFYLFSSAKLYWWGHGTMGRQGWAGRLFRRFFYALSDGVLVYGDGGKSTLIDNGINPDKIHVIYNCLNLEDYGLDYKKEGDNNTLRILFSGRLTKAKKVDELVRLGKSLSASKVDFRIDILGDGPELDNLVNLVADEGLNQSIIFHGPKYGAEAHPFFQRANLFVHPGAIGLSIIHALSFGLPVITSKNNERTKPELEVLENGVNGSLYPVGNVAELKRTVLDWHEKLCTDGLKVVNDCQSSIKNYTPSEVAEHIIRAIH